MRYVRPDGPGLLQWLQAELPRATQAVVVTCEADESGVRQIREQVVALLEGGGAFTIVVPVARTAAAILAGLGIPDVGGFRVLVRQVPPGMHACALTGADGSVRGYIGAGDLTDASLTTGASGVLLDGARDKAAASELREDLRALVDAPPPGSTGSQLRDLMQPAMDQLERQHGRLTEKPGWPGVPTGFSDLDHLTGGLAWGDLWVLTGRSGVGKSILALDFLRSAAVQHSSPAALVQARDRASDTVLRILSAQARVAIHHLQVAGLTDDDWARLARTMGETAEAPLWIHAPEAETATVAPTAEAQIENAVRLTAAHDLRVLIVDDLPAGTTVEQLRELKDLARQRQTCVVAVVADGPDQTRDEVESAATLVADVIIRLDRDHDMTPGSNDPRAGEADLLVLRHRRGPIACITLAFQGHFARFSEMRVQ